MQDGWPGEDRLEQLLGEPGRNLICYALVNVSYQNFEHLVIVGNPAYASYDS